MKRWAVRWTLVCGVLLGLAGCAPTQTQPTPQPAPPEPPGLEAAAEASESDTEPPRYGALPDARRVQETTMSRTDEEGTSTVSLRAEMRLAVRGSTLVVAYTPLQATHLDIKQRPLAEDWATLIAGASGYAWAIDSLGAVDWDGTTELAEHEAQQFAQMAVTNQHGMYAPVAVGISMLSDALRLPVLPKQLPEPGMELVYSEETIYAEGRFALPLLETHMWRLESATEAETRWTLERTAYGSDDVPDWGPATLERTERGTLTLERETHLPVAFTVHVEERLVNSSGVSVVTTDIESNWKTE